jgi:TonB-dependent SusC/RagA subfamily outer membrane receptor
MWKNARLFPCLLTVLCLSLAARPQSDRPIELKTLSIDIKADLFIATTTLQMEFYNPNNKVLDGQHNFSLASGQVITGFWLDINGFMREGVMVDKQKGRVAYENTIRRRIDPGLLEMTAGDNYRVRIYPMPANGTRKIKIVISQRLIVKNDSLQYHLPLSIPYVVKDFTMRAAIASGDQLPVAGSGLLLGLLFNRKEDSFYLHHEAKGKEIKDPLAFKIPMPSVNEVICITKTDNTTRFAFHIKPSLLSAPATFSSATVFWDVSASSDKRDIKKDLDFLENFIIQRKVTDLTLVTFSNEIHDIKAWHGRSMTNLVRKFLQSQVYDGGTQFGNLDCTRFNSDIFLLFSDGMNSFGSDKLRLASKPVHCISSSPASNHTWLKRISRTTGGRYIDLYSTTIGKAIDEFNVVQKSLIKIQTGEKTISLDQPVLFDDWASFAGETTIQNEPIVLSFGDNGRIVKSETIRLDLKYSCDGETPAKAKMLLEYDHVLHQDDEKSLLAFAKLNKVVSAATSFIVLDNLDDYIQYGIEPPSDLQEQYNKMLYVIKERERQKKIEEENEVLVNLNKSVTLYNERIAWWGKTDLININGIERRKENAIAFTQPAGNAVITNVGVARGDMFYKTSSSSLNEVVVTGYGSQRRMSVTGSVTNIQSREIGMFGNVQQVIAGRVAGVQIVNNSSVPGAAPQLFIRGAGTTGSGNEPLYLLDGLPVDGEFVATLNTSNLESISVVKDASATALYGSRAAHGAIIITSKRNLSDNDRDSKKIPKYNEMEDVEYVEELKNTEKVDMYSDYLEKRKSLGKNQAFYFDIAQLMFESGQVKTAVRILSNLSEIETENHQLLRAMAYVLESWGMYDEAVKVYEKVLTIKEEEPQSYRDLALVYEKRGEHQKAVDILYKSLTSNWFQYEDRYRGLKSLILNEMNGIIARNGNTIDLSKINAAVIKSLPVDLRIVIDWNKDETDIDLHIAEPDGETCFYQNKQTKAGGRLSEDFTQGYGPEEYQIKQAKNGKYLIRVNYYGDRYQQQQVPTFIKLTIYKNFGKPNQTATIQSMVMNHQTGMIEIGDVKY